MQNKRKNKMIRVQLKRQLLDTYSQLPALP